MLKSIVVLCLLLFCSGCQNFGDMRSHWVTVEKRGAFIIVDNDKLKNLIADQFKGNDDPLPQIGWLITYGGNPYPAGITLEAYACKHIITNNFVSAQLTKNKNEALILMSKALLKQAKVINDNDEVTDDLCFRSYLRNNHNIPEEKYTITINKEEINRALEELENY